MQMLVKSNIQQLIRRATVSSAKVITKGMGVVEKLTKYAEKKMKYHAPSRTKRSTGKLKNRITSEVKGSVDKIRGIAYVPKNLGIYPIIVEIGRKYKHKAIKVSHIMKFPVGNWKKGSRNSGILKLSDGKFFRFKTVSQGKVKGKFFTKKAYDDLLKFYSKQQQKYMSLFRDDLIIRRY